MRLNKWQTITVVVLTVLDGLARRAGIMPGRPAVG